MQPRIRRLTVSNFRGLAHTEWWPVEGMNIIIGGGDSGKSTLLHALSLVFSPTNAVQLLETDYYNRLLEPGFTIEATISLPEDIGLANFQQALWPWEWDGEKAVLPDNEREGALRDPVYIFQLVGTSDLELVWQIIQPNLEPVSLSTGLRRRVGVVRLASDDRNDRDLRLVSGSALDRLLSKGSLKSRISKEVSAADLSNAMTENEQRSLETLDKSMAAAGLPSGLDLGLTSSQGLSIGALVGLLAEKTGTLLPVSSWGAGTRRMAALEIARATEASTRLTVIDEIERGLEPYRLRQLLETLSADEQQCFVTTHSPVVLAAAKKAALWYIDGTGRVGRLPQDKIARQQSRDPETFLSRVPIIAEGITEVGFLRVLLKLVFEGKDTVHGIRVVDGGGNEAMLGVLEALKDAGISVAGFCDDEGKFPGRWTTLKAAAGPKLFQWQKGCLEENIIVHVPDSSLFSLAYDNDGVSGDRLRTLADRLNIQDKSETAILSACGSYDSLRKLIVEAATGDRSGASRDPIGKEWSKHSQKWFKTLSGGAELCEKMISLRLWHLVEPAFLPFLNAIRAEVAEVALHPGELTL